LLHDGVEDVELRGSPRRYDSSDDAGQPSQTDDDGEVNDRDVEAADAFVVQCRDDRPPERLFVSPRTVATHMEHIFQKFGCANRVELAADTARRDLTR
jgi:hypothetical protein